MTRYDVLVSGSGVTGAVTAIGLARAGLKVALLERQVGAVTERVPNCRVVAIAPASAAILQRLDLWPMPASLACAYARMQVDAGGERLDFEAASIASDALGWITDLDALQQRCWNALEPAVRVFAPTRIVEVERSQDGVRVELDDGQWLRARLLVIAEGARSDTRSQLGFEWTVRDYHASGLVAQVQTEQANPGIAYQRFAVGGPLALLPLADGRSSIVWTRPTEEARRWLAASDAELTGALSQASGLRFGRVCTVERRALFPLNMAQADGFARDRVALVGDSAHLVHPLAGLGLNLGLLDVAALIDVVSTAQAANRDIGGSGTLRRYASWREGDTRLAAGMIDVIERVFGDQPSAFQKLSERAVGVVDALPLLKRFFSMQAAGWGGRTPSLALPLSPGDSLRSSPGIA